MRILVAADSHGDYMTLKRVIEREQQKSPLDAFFFLGDIEDDYQMATLHLGGLTTLHVRGNNDWDASVPLSQFAHIGGCKFLICHGHGYGINQGYDRLISAANQNGCNAALFGHTHCRHYSFENGVHLFNPGSIALPRDGNNRCYGIITGENGKPDFYHCDV